jgi:hypothetical protein
MSEIHDSVLVLYNASVFRACTIDVVVVVNDIGNANGILGLYG